MAVSQVGSTTTSYYVTNGANSASTSSMTSTSSATSVSSTTLKVGSASTTSSTTAISSTTSYASATAKTTCSTTVTYSGSSSTAKVSSTTVATVEATSTNKTGASASTTASTTISSSTPIISMNGEDDKKVEFLSELYTNLKKKLEDDSFVKKGLLTLVEVSASGGIFDYLEGKVKQEIYDGILNTVLNLHNKVSEWVEERNALVDEEVFAGMTYEEIQKYRCDNAVSSLCKELYEKYKEEIHIENDEYKETAYYDSNTNSIYLSKTEDIKNIRGYLNTYFHEVGHCMDDVSDYEGHTSNNELYNFSKALREDYENLITTFKGDREISDEEVYQEIVEWMTQSVDMKSGISDLLYGLSDGKIAGKWGHDMDYYNTTTIEWEAFAHFFEAGMSYKPEKLMYILEVFPKSYKVFTEMLEDELE